MNTDLQSIQATIEKYIPMGSLKSGDVEDIDARSFAPLTPNQVGVLLCGSGLAKAMGFKSISLQHVNGPRGGRKTVPVIRVRG
jgi:hypothetical protein